MLDSVDQDLEIPAADLEVVDLVAHLVEGRVLLFL